VSCTITKSVCCWLLVFFLVVISLELPTEILLVTFSKETFINEWDVQGTNISEGVHSLGWEG
jgi:hypothetical protein